MNPIPFGRYLLTERLAAGGCAEIFKAKLLGVEGFEKTVAIKRILPHWSANQHFITMLIDEAKIMVRLNHEKVVQVHELGKEGETYYIAMEFVEGVDLKHFTEHLKNKNESVKIEEAIFIIIEMLRGLDYIHKQKDETGKNLNIVHRDISPQNILISQEGSIKIADFGIAHATSRSYETATGILKGKFSYMSPEQASGGIVNEQTDLFAVAIIFYELLTAQRLFSGKGDLEVLEKVKRFNSEEFFKSAKIDEALKPVFIRALHQNQKKRYLSGQEFLKDLEEARKNYPLYNSENLSARLKNFGENFSQKKSPDAIQSRQTRMVEPEKGHSPDEITSSLPEQFSESPLSEGKRKSFRPVRLVGLVGLVLILATTAYFFQPHKKSATLKPIVPISSEPSFSPDLTKAVETGIQKITPLASSDFNPHKNEKPKKIELKEIKEKKEEKTDTLSGQGLLSVKANPWGKISIAGVINNSEHPVAKILSYGNYQVSVNYKTLEGEWKSISRNVKVAKKGTYCIASFSMEGNGSINCR